MSARDWPTTSRNRWSSGSWTSCSRRPAAAEGLSARKVPSSPGLSARKVRSSPGLFARKVRSEAEFGANLGAVLPRLRHPAQGPWCDGEPLGDVGLHPPVDLQEHAPLDVVPVGRRL